MPAAIPVAAAIGGALISSQGAKSAAGTQAAAADRATQSQRDMFDTQMGMQAPWRTAGSAAQAKLNTLLGLPNADPTQNESADQIRARLLPQFTTTAQPSGAPPTYIVGNDADPGGWTSDPNAPPSIDETGLNAAIQAEQAKQQAAASANSSDPSYGSLLKPFSMSDFEMDPGTQFRLKYGQQALQNSQAAKNGVLSGGALKDLMQFNQDYAGTGYQSAFDRYMANKQFSLGSLMGVSGMGQAAASNAANNGATMANGIANTITGAGNAQAAGAVGSANALSGGLTSAGNTYFLSSLLGKSGGGDLAAANNSTDPIGTMNSLNGWTTTA